MRFQLSVNIEKKLKGGKIQLKKYHPTWLNFVMHILRVDVSKIPQAIL